MTTYILRRLIQSAVVIWITTMVLFLIVHLLPGDPVTLYITQDLYSRLTSVDELKALKHIYGLDKPLLVQYINWVWNGLHGDFGKSIFWGTTVFHEVRRCMPVSLFFGFGAWVFSHGLGILMGIVTAVRRGKWEDNVITTLANLGLTIPNFWLGILVIYVFALWLGWFPIQGYVSPLTDFGSSIRHWVLPMIVLAVFPAGGSVRQTRSSMLEVVRQDYIRTAYSKGLSERDVIMKHALKNALIPVVTLTGMSIPQIFGGQVLIETVFNIPGMGKLTTDALNNQDYAIMQGITLMMCIIVVFSNLLVDISYAYLDPRVRYR